MLGVMRGVVIPEEVSTAGTQSQLLPECVVDKL